MKRGRRSVQWIVLTVAAAAAIALPAVLPPEHSQAAARIGAPPQSTSSKAVPQVSDVRAVHRAGQTFVTWREIETPALAAEPSAQSVVTLRRELAKRFRYRIYRSSQPIASLDGLEPIGVADPLSAWNTDHHGIDPVPALLAFRYRIVDLGEPLEAGTGLYVHNPGRAGDGFYAVTVSLDGAENQTVTDSNRTETAVQETVGAGVPVIQRVERPATFAYVDKPESLTYYTRWEAPPNANRENVPIDYLVAVPSNVSRPATVGIHLHAYGANLSGGWGWWFNGSRGAILVSSNELPYDWWTGYHEKLNVSALASREDWRSGVVRPYTQTRLLSFVKWLASTRPIDLTRTFAAGNSMGGSGSLMLAIRYPDDVAWAESWVGVHRPHLTPTFRNSYANVYGPPEFGVLFEDGTPVWEHYDDATYLRRHQDRGIGFLTFSNGKNDNDIGWPQAVDFFRALQETRQPHLFVWGQNGHGERAAFPAGGGEATMPLDLRTNRSLPAFTRGSLDDDPGDGRPETGTQSGQANLFLYWDPDSIVDTVDRWEVVAGVLPSAPRKPATADLTPRRSQAFKPAPEETIRWTNTAGGQVIGRGEVIVDRYGLVTVPAVEFVEGRSRIQLQRAVPADR